MTSKLTRERLQEIAEDGFLKHGESKELARMALAEKASEPVILYRERNPYNGLTTGWQELTENEFSFLKENAGENAEFLALYRHAQPATVTERDPIAWLNDAYLARGVVDGEAGSEDAGPGYIPVYREAGPQPAPVVSDDLLSMAASAIEDLLEHTDPNTSYYSGVWADMPGKLRAAMLQAGNYRENANSSTNNCRKIAETSTNSPVIGIDPASGPDCSVEVRYVAPPGYVMVPKVATEKMLIAGLEEADPLGSLIDWDASRGDCNTREQVQEMFEAMLAAAPQEVK
ncbi:hypothetical protein [Klebsiella quasipneumoniae]|uniref:hypothetical protein n=1 Tax=Klebsiella quasipneumoniae TaxID=1463165 RepID=UPI003F45D005